MFSEELIYAIALSKLFQYKPIWARELIDYFGNAKEVFNLSPDDFRKLFGRSYSFIEEIQNSDILNWAENELKWCDSKRIKVSYIKDLSFPKRLLECPDSPIILYEMGDIDLNSPQIVSIVGTRKCTNYGQKVCSDIIESFAKEGYNPIIVSGLAYGIDICAHKAALDIGLQTLAVLPCGLNKIYPAAHTQYAKKIINQGGLITDFSRATAPYKLNFLQRNRIIAAISQATILIESAEKGGGIITAKLAQSYSKELFAVPGKIYDNFSSGCNHLINANIAQLYYSVKEIAQTLNWQTANSKGSGQVSLFEVIDGDKQKIIVALASNFELTIDEISFKTELSISQLSTCLLELELMGKIKNTSGNRYCLN